MLETLTITSMEYAARIYQDVMHMLNVKKSLDINEDERIIKKLRKDSKATQPVYEIIIDYNLGTKVNLSV